MPPRSAGKTALAASVLLCVALMGATCWRWSGAQARAMSLEQAVEAAQSGQPDAVRALYLKLVQARAELVELAKQEDDVGARARMWLELAEKKR